MVLLLLSTALTLAAMQQAVLMVAVPVLQVSLALLA
jgi:hypothetical protein